jgi:hypothetical protein
MSESRDWEEEARSDGWVPEDEHKGEPPKGGFVDAETFVKRGEERAGILRSKVERLEDRVESLTETNRMFKDFHETSIQKERREKAALMEQLEAQRAEAVTAGDGQTFTRVDNELQQLRTELPADPMEETFQRVASSWQQNNNWYGANDKLTTYADGLSPKLQAQYSDPAEYFAELTRRTKEAFPDEFRTAAPSVESGGERQSEKPKPNSFGALPPDAQAACKQFERDIPGFTRDQYLKDYDWDDE